jgi:tellurite resistance protein TerC
MDHFGFPLETLIIFFAVIGLSVAVDLAAHRRAQKISVRGAVTWTLVWVGLALGFYAYLWLRFDPRWAELFLTGYVLEESLSIDNLMVFMAIFASFGIRGAMQHRILYWGILGAMLFRAIFVVAGSALFELTPWVGFGFAAIVAWSGWKMLTRSETDEEIEDYSHHWSVQLTRRLIPVHPRLEGDRFIFGRAATPALLCLIAIETADVIFAFDSVPAVIAVTREPLLVYAAMIFAVLGLRSLYFVLAALAGHLVHLEKAVIALLFFIAAKLGAESGRAVFGWPIPEIDATLSLLVVLGTLGLGVIASLIWQGRK